MKCNKCGNEIKEEEQFCGKCGNKINPTNNSGKLKNKSSLLVLLIVIIFVVIVIGVMIYNNSQVNRSLEQAKTNPKYIDSSSKVPSEYNSNNTLNNTSKDEKLSLENIKLQNWYNANDTNIDEATLKLFNLAWQGVIKEYYPNAVLNKFTIYDKDNYGRYIVGIDFVKSSISEGSTYNWCCVWVKDINDANKMGYWKTNPKGVSYIYNDSSYGWGTPLPDDL